MWLFVFIGNASLLVCTCACVHRHIHVCVCVCVSPKCWRVADSLALHGAVTQWLKRGKCALVGGLVHLPKPQKGLMLTLGHRNDLQLTSLPVQKHRLIQELFHMSNSPTKMQRSKWAILLEQILQIHTLLWIYNIYIHTTCIPSRAYIMSLKHLGWGGIGGFIWS